MGTTGVRIAQVAMRDHDVDVIHKARIGAVQDGDEARSANMLTRCFQQEPFKGKTVHLAMAASDVEYHTLEIPLAILEGSEDNIAKVVSSETSRLMTFGANPVEIRYWRLPDTPSAAPNTVGVVAKLDSIQRIIGDCATVGLNCACVDTPALAMSRFGVVLGNWKNEEIWGITDIGHHHTRLAVCVGEAPILVRSIGPGVQKWKESVAEALQVSENAAEVQMRDHGVALATRGTRQAVNTETSRLASLILGAIRSEVNKLANEIKRSYEYVLGCYPQRQVRDLILCGGGSLTPNIAELIARMLGIEVHRASDYLGREGCRLRWTSTSRNALEHYAVAIGLAIGEA